MAADWSQGSPVDGRDVPIRRPERRLPATSDTGGEGKLVLPVSSPVWRAWDEVALRLAPVQAEVLGRSLGLAFVGRGSTLA